MNVLDEIKAALRPMGLYRFDGSTLVEKELSTEASPLQEIFDAAEQFRNELFVSTAEDEGLRLRESLCGKEKSTLSVSSRREMLLFRGAVTAASNTREQVEKALAACGMLCTLNEFTDRLYVNCYGFLDHTLTASEAVRAAGEFLPAHMPCYFDFRPLTWREIGERALTFAQMEQAALTWRQIDSN